MSRTGPATALAGEGRPAGAAEIDVVAWVLSSTQAPVIAGKVDAVQQQGVAPSPFVPSEGSHGNVEVRNLGRLEQLSAASAGAGGAPGARSQVGGV